MVVVVSGSEQTLALLATRYLFKEVYGKAVETLQLSMDGISISILISRKSHAELFSE